MKSRIIKNSYNLISALSVTLCWGGEKKSHNTPSILILVNTKQELETEIQNLFKVKSLTTISILINIHVRQKSPLRVIQKHL